MALNLHSACIVAYVEQRVGTAVAQQLEKVATGEWEPEEMNGNAMAQARKILQDIVKVAGEDDNLGLNAQDMLNQIEPRTAPSP